VPPCTYKPSSNIHAWGVFHVVPQKQHFQDKGESLTCLRRRDKQRSGTWGGPLDMYEAQNCISPL
jgi:hypothetical protein